MQKKLIKNVSFRNNDAEIMLMEHANSKRNFSEWVKQKLEEDMTNVRIGEPNPVEKPVENQVDINIDDNLF